MAFAYEISHTSNYVKITLKGVMDNVEETLSFMTVAGKFCKDAAATQVLIDEREMLHRFPKKDLVIIANAMANAYPTIKKFAITGSREDTLSRDLFAGFTVVQNFRTCSFEDIEEAHTWLTS